MSGHSKWSTIKRKKGVNDAKRGKLFAKLIRGIEVAARNGGTDPNNNASLYQAISKAKTNSVPNDNIERALKRLSGDTDGKQFEEIYYEGYGPHGVAILVECLTDNKNRTSSDIKATFNRHNGNTGSPGSVNYLFKRKAIFQFDNTSETLINLAIDNDCLEINESNNSLNLEFRPSEFKIIYELFKKNNYIPTNSEVAYIPETSVMLDIKMFKDVTRIIEALEELDDVQNVYSNFDIDDKLLDNALTI